MFLPEFFPQFKREEVLSEFSFIVRFPTANKAVFKFIAFRRGSQDKQVRVFLFLLLHLILEIAVYLLSS